MLGDYNTNMPNTIAACIVQLGRLHSVFSKVEEKLGDVSCLLGGLTKVRREFGESE